jgi:hypothetical protein
MPADARLFRPVQHEVLTIQCLSGRGAPCAVQPCISVVGRLARVSFV